MKESLEARYARWNELIRQGDRRWRRWFIIRICAGLIGTLAGVLLVQWLLRR